MRSLLAAVLLCVTVAGCATAPSPEMLARFDGIAARREPAVVSTGAFSIVDQRAKDAALLRLEPVGWAGGFSCNVGIAQIGYQDYATDRLARLQNALAEAFPEKAKGSELVVRRFDIYVNRGAEADALAMSAAMGSVGVFGAGGVGSSSPGIWRAPKCRQNKMSGGWFDPAELTNNNPPLTVDLDVTVFGTAYAVNAAQSPELDTEELGMAIYTKSPAFETLLQPLMNKAIARLVEKVKASGGGS